MQATIDEPKTVVIPPVTFSEKAISEVKAIRENDQIPLDQKLRVGVKGGGCSGMTYVLAFDEVGEHDDHFTLGGVEMVMDKRHSIYLESMHIDFQDGLNARGFTFNNPNASSTCGCGTSFSA